MKIVTIGDIHGLTIWKEIVNKHPDADKIIFIGDYTDAYGRITGHQELKNLDEIIAFKKNNKEQVTLLFGNHKTN